MSYRARPSRKNSGEKIIFLNLNLARISAVYPTGTVLLIIIIAWGLTSITNFMTSSTWVVSK